MTAEWRLRETELWRAARTSLALRFCNVRYWHKADVQTALMDVRFEGKNGHDADVTRFLLMTQSGHS